MIDPFDDEADPLRLDGSRPPAPREPDATPDEPAMRSQREHDTGGIEMGRRPVVLGLALLPWALNASGCVRLKPACPTRPDDSHHCRHRFCRYSGHAPKW